MNAPSISDYLYTLRDEAGIAADKLKREIADATATLKKLERIADGAELAAELVAASDLQPTTSGTIPPAAGLERAAVCTYTIPRCEKAGQHQPTCRCVLPAGHEGDHASEL